MRITAGWLHKALIIQRIVFQDAVAAIEDAIDRLRQPEDSSVVDGAMVAAYQAMRGISSLVAVTFAAEIGHIRRFDSPRQLMSFLGLVPAECSTGETLRRVGLPLAGNRRARRVPDGRSGLGATAIAAHVSETPRTRLGRLTKTVSDIAWKAQVRLRSRYRRLNAAGKKLPVITAAIAREMASVPAGDWPISEPSCSHLTLRPATALLHSVGNGAAEGNFRCSFMWPGASRPSSRQRKP